MEFIVIISIFAFIISAASWWYVDGIVKRYDLQEEVINSLIQTRLHKEDFNIEMNVFAQEQAKLWKELDMQSGKIKHNHNSIRQVSEMLMDEIKSCKESCNQVEIPIAISKPNRKAKLDAKQNKPKVNRGVK